ncbi:MAG: AmmeMemoRadiSam system radical SAM enzyme [Candidatus Omnitrophica bacterium]|nr:AmmeMemoRadiSam system radical SAM enzyme [Candidatus Omnitrophota bacterium]
MISAERLEKIWREKLSRRDFISKCVATGATVAASMYLFDALSKYEAYASVGEKRGMREALFYEKISDDIVRCKLCPEECVLSNGQRGFCRVRGPVKGKLYSFVYELVCAMHVDPIEKKPMFHVLPGSRSFSIATAGCNSRCKFCQNWTISQRPPEQTNNRVLTKEGLVGAAVMNGCSSIAYTYTEPIVFYEYTVNASREAHKKGLKNIIVTGGKIRSEPLKMMCKTIDAANVDLKGFDRKYLKEVCAQDLDNILQTLVILKKHGVWVEITNLIVPTLNDDMNDIRRMVRWIKDNLGEGVPVHFSRFWPQYKLRSLYPTPVSTLKQAREIAMEEGLKYVYIGNVPQTASESTICPGCGRVIIKRIGYKVLENHVVNGKCKFCGCQIEGIWS